MLIKERADLLAAYLDADIENAKKLLELSAEDAADKINANGYDFSVEEVAEFGAQLQKAIEATQKGELSEDALNDVAGGFVFEGVMISCVVLGFKIGSSLAKTWGW